MAGWQQDEQQSRNSGRRGGGAQGSAGGKGRGGLPQAGSVGAPASISVPWLHICWIIQSVPPPSAGVPIIAYSSVWDGRAAAVQVRAVQSGLKRAQDSKRVAAGASGRPGGAGMARSAASTCQRGGGLHRAAAEEAHLDNTRVLQRLAELRLVQRQLGGRGAAGLGGEAAVDELHRHHVVPPEAAVHCGGREYRDGVRGGRKRAARSCCPGKQWQPACRASAQSPGAAAGQLKPCAGCGGRMRQHS